MSKAPRAVPSRARRKRVFKAAKGFYGRRKNTITNANAAVDRSMQHAYVGRKLKKRNFRALWIQRINAIPLTGHIPELPGQRGVRHVATPGPLARCVPDLVLALQVMAGPDPSHPDVPPVPLTPAPEPAWKDLRVAWVEEFGGIPVTRDTRAALVKLVAALQEQGCTVTRRLPDNIDFPGVWETYGELRQCEVGGAMPPELEEECAANFGVRAQSDDPEMRGMARRLNATLRQYTATLAKRDVYIAAMEQFFESWDVLLCPVTVGPAFVHCAPGTPIPVDDGHVPYRLGGTGYTSVPGGAVDRQGDGRRGLSQSGQRGRLV